VSDDRSPIGIVNKEAADRRKQRRKGHIQIIEEDRKRLKMENDRLTAELAEANGKLRNTGMWLVPPNDVDFLGFAYVSGGQVVVTGSPDPDDESHNCDAMGCGQSHVVFRAAIDAGKGE
jgi:hypothetical protein